MLVPGHRASRVAETRHNSLHHRALWPISRGATIAGPTQPDKLVEIEKTLQANNMKVNTLVQQISPENVAILDGALTEVRLENDSLSQEADDIRKRLACTTMAGMDPRRIVSHSASGYGSSAGCVDMARWRSDGRFCGNCCTGSRLILSPEKGRRSGTAWMNWPYANHKTIF